MLSGKTVTGEVSFVQSERKQMEHDVYTKGIFKLITHNSQINQQSHNKKNQKWQKYTN